MELAEGELAQINALSRKELKAGEVYAFGVRLCDNEIDRDGERFPLETLQELERLFVGKSGVFDHQWSALGDRPLTAPSWCRRRKSVPARGTHTAI